MKKFMIGISLLVTPLTWAAPVADLDCQYGVVDQPSFEREAQQVPYILSFWDGSPRREENESIDARMTRSLIDFSKAALQKMGVNFNPQSQNRLVVRFRSNRLWWSAINPIEYLVGGAVERQRLEYKIVSDAGDLVFFMRSKRIEASASGTITDIKGNLEEFEIKRQQCHSRENI